MSVVMTQESIVSKGLQRLFSNLSSLVIYKDLRLMVRLDLRFPMNFLEGLLIALLLAIVVILSIALIMRLEFFLYQLIDLSSNVRFVFVLSCHLLINQLVNIYNLLLTLCGCLRNLLLWSLYTIFRLIYIKHFSVENSINKTGHFFLSMSWTLAL